jgi:hypothetical protein
VVVEWLLTLQRSFRVSVSDLIAFFLTYSQIVLECLRENSLSEDLDSSDQVNLWYHEQPVVYHDSKSHSQLDHSFLRPIRTTSSPDPSSERKFQDWTVLSDPNSHSITMQIHILRLSPGSPGSLGTLVCFNMSSSSDTACKLLCRTYLHRQHPSDQDTAHYTRL